MKWTSIFFILAYILSGCGKKNKQDVKFEKIDRVEEKVSNEHKVDEDNEYIVNQDIDKHAITSSYLPSEIIDANDYNGSETRFMEFVDSDYSKLNGVEFMQASEELIRYRNFLAGEKQLEAWLLASTIENVVSKGVIRNLQSSQLSSDEVNELVRRFSHRIYTSSSMAEVIDNELGLGSDLRFSNVKQSILKEKMKLKDSSKASTAHEYRALLEHVGGLGAENGGFDAITAMVRMYDVHAESVMLSAYIKYLEVGGPSFYSLEEDSLATFKSTIGNQLSSVYLPEFHSIGPTKISADSLMFYLRKNRLDRK